MRPLSTIATGSDQKQPLDTGQEKHLSSGQRYLNQYSGALKKQSLILSPLFEIWDTLKGDLMDRQNSPKYPIGLTDIDSVLWGLHKKELVTIGARTSHGKTAFAINMVKELADKGNRIIYFSLEMSKESLLERLFCNICEVDNIELRQGRAKQDVLNNEKIFLNWLQSSKILIEDRYGYNFNNIVNICETIQPDFVFVDYIQMISTIGYRSKVDAIEEYVRKIKELAVLKNFGVILISQINRHGAENPGMQYLKWSGVLEEHSDVVMTLKWAWNTEKFKYEYFVNIEKQRHGEVKNVELEFLPQYSKFKDALPETAEPRPNTHNPGLYQD